MDVLYPLILKRGKPQRFRSDTLTLETRAPAQFLMCYGPEFSVAPFRD